MLRHYFRFWLKDQMNKIAFDGNTRKRKKRGRESKKLALNHKTMWLQMTISPLNWTSTLYCPFFFFHLCHIASDRLRMQIRMQPILYLLFFLNFLHFDWMFSINFWLSVWLLCMAIFTHIYTSHHIYVPSTFTWSIERAREKIRFSAKVFRSLGYGTYINLKEETKKSNQQQIIASHSTYGWCGT